VTKAKPTNLHNINLGGLDFRVGRSRNKLGDRILMLLNYDAKVFLPMLSSRDDISSSKANHLFSVERCTIGKWSDTLVQ